MMLLAAVVLILAFLALSAMVARVSQLGSVTGQDQSRPILLEVESVQAAVADVLSQLDAVGLADQATYEAEAASVFEHLAFLERARGFRFTLDTFVVTGTCDPATELTVELTYTLSDGEVKVSLADEGIYTCPPPPPP